MALYRGPLPQALRSPAHASPHDPYVRIRGTPEPNPRGVGVPRDVLAVLTGVSGSGTSSLALGTIYAEAQRSNRVSFAMPRAFRPMVKRM